MLNSRVRNASDLIRLAGRTPAFAAAAIAAATVCLTPFIATATAAAQPLREQGRVDVSDAQLVSLAVKDENLATVLELLSIQTQQNIIVSRNVSATITATIYDVTFEEALNAILNVNGFVWERDGNFIYVYTVQEYRELERIRKQRVVEIVKLNYLSAKDAASFVEPLLSKEGGEIKLSAEARDFTIPADGPVGAENYAMGSTLVIIDYEENVAAIKALLGQLDTRPAQVLVEATILQSAITEANAFGTDFSIIGDLNFTDFMSVGGPLSAADALLRGDDGFAPPNNRGTAVSSTPGNTQGPSTLKIGVISNDISVFVRMLDEVSDTTIISNPKMLTLNRQPGRVLVGRRVGYLSTTSTDTATTQSVQFLDTGTQLFFRPFVSDRGEIRMELKPQVSEAIIRTATDVSGAAVTIPDEITQEIVTNVIVRDGQTVVLGGLFKESTTRARRQVPFLGDIPILGAAFRGHEDDVSRQEIIFMITPSIVSDSIINESAARSLDETDRLRAGARQGLLPWSNTKLTGSLNLEAHRHAAEGEFDRAMWHVSRSLSLNPNQPDVLRLRERILGEREIWPSKSLLHSTFDRDLTARLRANPQPTERARELNPVGSQPVPRGGSKEFPSNFQGDATKDAYRNERRRWDQMDLFEGAATGAQPFESRRTRSEQSTMNTNVDPFSYASNNNSSNARNQNSETSTKNNYNSNRTNNNTGSDNTLNTPFNEPDYTDENYSYDTNTDGYDWSNNYTPFNNEQFSNNSQPTKAETTKTPSTKTSAATPSGQPGMVRRIDNSGTTSTTGNYDNQYSNSQNNNNNATPAIGTTGQQASATGNSDQNAAGFDTDFDTNFDSDFPFNADEPFANAADPNPTQFIDHQVFRFGQPVGTVRIPAPAPYTTMYRSTEDNFNFKDLRDNYTKLTTDLTSIRTYIERFEAVNNGELPLLGYNADGVGQLFGWVDLVEMGFLSVIPSNPFVPANVARTVAIRLAPDAAFDPSYGFAYNPETGEVWANGFNLADFPRNDMPASKSELPSWHAWATQNRQQTDIAGVEIND